jgi:hypothetical protein
VLSRLVENEDWLRPDEYCVARAKQYMDDPRSDLAFFGIHQNAILMKRVPDPAFWRKVSTEPKEALAEFLRFRPTSLNLLGPTKKGVSANSWEFYVEALKAGVILYGTAIEFPRLSPKDNERIAELIEMQRAYVMDEYDQDNCEVLDHRFAQDTSTLLYRARILDQAETMGGFITFPVKHPFKLMTNEAECMEVTVPAAPFLLWAQTRFEKRAIQGALPDWKLICPSGLKMLGDSRMHTDWWIGAGLSPRWAYDNDHPVNKAAWHFAWKMSAKEGRNCIVLAGTGKTTGVVVAPAPNTAVPAGSIVVVPHAGVEYELALLSACKEGTGVVIAEVGGQLAHLSIVSRELGLRLVIMDNALNQFGEGDVVTVSLTDRLISKNSNND